MGQTLKTKQANKQVMEDSENWSADSEQFARLLIHDLINPLTSLSLILESNTKLIGNDHNFLEHTRDRIRCLTHTLSVLLGKKTEGMIMSVQNELRYITDSMLARTKRYGISFIFMHDIDVVLFVEPRIFYRIFLNLISNAIDSYENSELAAKKVIIRSKKCKKFVKIMVEDFGCGIKSTTTGDRASTKSEGTGCGLEIVRKYVASINASVTFKEKAHGGTLASVYFPIDD